MLQRKTPKTAKSLKEESPFTSYFGNAVRDSSPISMDGCDNTNYCPEGIQCIEDMMHLYPLWAGALHQDVRRFANDDISDSEASAVTRPRSNAKVESYFGDLKTHCLSSMRQRPAEFVRDELLNVKGRLNATKLLAVARLPRALACALRSTRFLNTRIFMISGFAPSRGRTSCR